MGAKRIKDHFQRIMGHWSIKKAKERVYFNATLRIELNPVIADIAEQAKSVRSLVMEAKVGIVKSILLLDLHDKFYHGIAIQAMSLLRDFLVSGE